jgi:hypothetical protein
LAAGLFFVFGSVSAAPLRLQERVGPKGVRAADLYYTNIVSTKAANVSIPCLRMATPGWQHLRLLRRRQFYYHPFCALQIKRQSASSM